MMGRVETLNASVKQEGARIVASRVGGAVHARLVADDAAQIPLTFFSDGVKLGRCQFEAFNSSTAQQLIRDILDGYFPYALKDDYPDGVTLKVIDRTTLHFATWLQEHSKTDKDLASGGDSLALVGAHAIKPPGTAVADKAPDRVGRDGQICEVHSPPQQKLRGGNAGARGISAPTLNRASNSEVSLLDEGRDPTSASARLQVKLDGGLRVVLCMEPHHTVGHLEDALEKWCIEHGSAGLNGSHLRTPFPPKTFSDREQTLLDAGLTPSATLFVAASAVS